MSDLTMTLKQNPDVPEKMATTAQLRALLPPGAKGTPLAVTLPQCDIDLTALDYDNPDGTWLFQGGEITLTLIQTIYLDARLSPCERTWILKHEKKHIQENQKFFQTDLRAKLKADSAFRTLTDTTTGTNVVPTATIDPHVNNIGTRISAVFTSLADEARVRIDTRSEYEDVDGKKKKYCGAGATTIPTFSVLRKGSVGSDVTFAQRLLNGGLLVGLLDGPKLEVDGDFGNGTKTRVLQFQKKVFIQDDGIIGPITWAMLMFMAPFSE